MAVHGSRSGPLRSDVGAHGAELAGALLRGVRAARGRETALDLAEGMLGGLVAILARERGARHMIDLLDTTRCRRAGASPGRARSVFVHRCTRPSYDFVCVDLSLR